MDIIRCRKLFSLFDLILAITMLSNFGKVLYFVESSFVLQFLNLMGLGWLSDDLVWRRSLSFVFFGRYEWKVGRCFWRSLELTEKISYPISTFKKLREWGYKKSLKSDSLCRRLYQNNRCNWRPKLCKNMSTNNFFPSLLYERESHLWIIPKPNYWPELLTNWN